MEGGMGHDYRISHIFLASLYFAFALTALIVYRIKHVWEKYCIGFMLLVVFGALLRAVSLLLYILTLNDYIRLGSKLLNIFNLAPSFLFITAYTITLILGIIINERRMSTNKSSVDLYKRGILIFNIIMYVVVAILIVLDFSIGESDPTLSVNTPSTTIETILQLFDAGIYLSTIVFMLIIFLLLNQGKTNGDPILSDNKTRQRFAIVIIVAILCFVSRGVLVVLTTFYPLNYWWKDILYYILLEILPLCFLLFIMGKHDSQKFLQGSPPLLGEHWNNPNYH